jgi:hypothetical protein
LFSPPLVRGLSASAAVESVRRIITVAGLGAYYRSRLLREIFESVYEILRARYRCEYVYKNAIASEILIGRHSLQTSGLLTEVQAGASKADLVLINGETVAYEIKTELDSLDRLSSQLASYQTAFDRVYVVSHERYLDRIAERLPRTVGLLCLTGDATISSVREADKDPTRLDAGTMFDILRRSEYTSIIKKFYGQVPTVPNTLYYRECRARFLALPTEDVCGEFAAALKLRAQGAVSLPLCDLVRTPHSLLLHVLTGQLGPQHFATLDLALT